MNTVPNTSIICQIHAEISTYYFKNNLEYSKWCNFYVIFQATISLKVGLKTVNKR